MKTRKIYLDAIKMFALFLVIYNHTGDLGYSYYKYISFGIEYIISIFFSSFCQISVPLFLMVSGANLLGKKETITSLYKNRVLRFVILIVITCLCNYLYHYLVLAEKNTSIFHIINDFFTSTKYCTYYLWVYLGFLIGLPLLRILSKDKSSAIYCLAVFFVCNTLFPYLTLFTDLNTIYINNYVTFFRGVYVFPLLGYFLDNLQESYFFRKNIYIGLGILVLATNIEMATSVYSHVNGFVSPTSFLTYISASCIFYLARSVYIYGSLPQFWEKLIIRMAPLTLGAFLISAILMWHTTFIYKYFCEYFPNLVATIIWVLISMIASQVCTRLIRIIPIIRRYL